MVYELLPNRTNRTEFVKTSKDGPDSSFALITSSAPIAILHTCRIIRNEASEIIHRTANRLPGVAPKIEADCDALEALLGRGGVLLAVIVLYQSMAIGSDGYLRVYKFVDSTQWHDFLQVYGYSPTCGTDEQGKRRIIDFVRKAIWALQHHRNHHPELLPEVHLLLQMRAEEDLSVFYHPIRRLRLFFQLNGPMAPNHSLG